MTGPGYVTSDIYGYIPIITPFTEEANRGKHRGATPEALANAYMWAASPDLLAALEDLVCCPTFTGARFEKDPESHKAWTLARAAIAKAKGVLA